MALGEKSVGVVSTFLHQLSCVQIEAFVTILCILILNNKYQIFWGEFCSIKGTLREMCAVLLVWELPRGDCFADLTPLGFNTLSQGAAHLGRFTGFACKSFSIVSPRCRQLKALCWQLRVWIFFLSFKVWNPKSVGTKWCWIWEAVTTRKLPSLGSFHYL